MKSTMIVRLGLGLAVTAMTVAVGATAQTDTSTDRTRMKPDLRITSFCAERTGLNPDGSHRVKLTVQVRCNGNFAGSCGPFKIRTELNDAAMGPYTLLSESGVASLSTGFGLAAAPMASRTFEDSVPAGRTRRYAATVDPGGTVDEANEGNNTARTQYAATGCAGVDLVITLVEMIRSSGDGVLFHVFVKNRCLERCTGDLYYSVTPTIPAGLAVEQGIGGGIEGEQTAGPLGTILTSGRRDHTLEYDVSVNVRGGTCRETSTTNNTCRVRLLATEDRKTVRCGS